jgi:hypothetical protein
VALFSFLLLIACERPSLPSTPTALPIATATPTVTIPPPTAEEGAPVDLTPGEHVRVVVYADAEPKAGSCLELLPDMLPVSASGMYEGVVSSCTVGSPEPVRLQFLEAAGGVLYINRVEFLLPTPIDLPDVRSRFCEELVQYLLRSNEDPRANRDRMSCFGRVLPREHEHTNVMKIWFLVPDHSPVQTFPEDIHCWELRQCFVGPPEARVVFEVPCILN